MGSSPRSSPHMRPTEWPPMMAAESSTRHGSSTPPGPRRHGHSPHRSIPGDPALGVYEPYDLIEIHAPPPNTRISMTIIAVPGSTGDVFDLWGPKWKRRHKGPPGVSYNEKKENFNWLQQGLAQEPEFANARIMTYRYPKVADDLTGQMATKGVPSLRGIADHLGTEIALKHTDNSAIVFIAISFGGLVVKELLATRPPKMPNPVSSDCVGVFFIGTPHRGLNDAQMSANAKFQKFQKATSWFPQNNLIRWIIDQTEDLRSLDESFRFQFHELDIVTLYETQPSRLIDRVLVDARAATLGTENERVIPVDRDHSNLCRFPAKDDEYYVILVQELKRMQERYATHAANLRRTNSRIALAEPERPGTASVSVSFVSPPPVPLGTPGQGKVPIDMQDKGYVKVSIQEFYVSTTIYDERSPKLPPASGLGPAPAGSAAGAIASAARMERSDSARSARRRNRSGGRQDEIDEVTLPGESRMAPITTMLEMGPRNWYKLRTEEEEAEREAQGEDSDDTDLEDRRASLPTVRETLIQRASRGGRTTTDYFVWVHVPLNVMAFAGPVLKVMCDENSIPFRILEDWRAKHRKSRGLQPYIHSHYMDYSSDLKIVRFQAPVANRRTGSVTSLSGSSGARDVPDLALDSVAAANEEDSADEGAPAQDRVVAQMAIYIPYLHWDTFRCFAARDHVYKRIAAGETNIFSDSPKKPLDKTVYKIAEDYLNNIDLPVHIRRTLDQFFYTYLPDTSKRDFDQRIAHQTKGSRGGPKMVMCDQAWIWILDANTLATFFTPKEKEDIDTDILLDADLKLAISNKANEEENFKSRNAYEMAACVIEAAVTVLFDASRTSSLKFLEIYREVIGKAAEDQTNFFTSFRDQLNQDILAGGKRTSISDVEFSNEDTAQKRTELSLALKVADVIDELNSILRLLDAQADVIQQVKVDMRTAQRVVRVPIGNALDTLDKASSHVAEYKRQIRRLISDSSRTQRGVLNLLDLKQKEASIEEQRVARWLQQDTHKLQVDTQEQGIEMEKQGRTILIFTTVTIVFLPLSFFTSWFGMNVSVYTGSTENPTLGHVWAYGAPITASVILLAFVTAFWEQILDSFRRTRVLLFQRGRKGRMNRHGDEASDKMPILPVAESSGRDKERDGLVNRGGSNERLQLGLNDSGPLIYEGWMMGEENRPRTN